MSTYGDEPVSVSHTAWRTARKEWHCSACQEPIPVGQTYRYVIFLFDGTWETFRRCQRCQIIHSHLSDRMRSEGDRYEYCADALDCGDTYEERWDEPPPEWLAALAFWRPDDPLPEAPK
jgi:hypothetical protein